MIHNLSVPARSQGFPIGNGPALSGPSSPSMSSFLSVVRLCGDGFVEKDVSTYQIALFQDVPRSGSAAFIQHSWKNIMPGMMLNMSMGGTMNCIMKNAAPRIPAVRVNLRLCSSDR